MRRAEREFFPHLAVVGVHAGKFTREGDSASILDAMRREEIRHPVVNDRDYIVWRNYGIRAWPTLVLMDPQGRVVARQEGELPYAALAERLRREIASAGRLGLLDGEAPPAADWSADGGILRFPGGLALADDGTVYIADSGHHRVVAWHPDAGIRDTWGEGTPGFADGGPVKARLRDPHGLALTGGGLLVADSGNHALRRIDLATGVMTTPWQDLREEPEEAPLGQQALRSPWDLADHGDSVFIAAAGSHQIWRLSLVDMDLRPYAGSGYEALYDADLARARLAQPMALAVQDGQLLVADAESSAVRSMPATPPGRVTTLVGTGLFDFGSRQGLFAQSLLQHPQGIAVLDGDIYVADTYNDQLVRLDQRSRVTSVALRGVRGPSALKAKRGDLYIADTGHHRLVRFSPGTGELAALL